MTPLRIWRVAVIVVGLAASTLVSAVQVTVDATAGPWDQGLAGNPSYGVGDQTGPAIVAVNAGDTIVITYVSGFTSSFGGVPPTVDAAGYVGSIFGSGADCGGSPCTGIGSSGQPLPSAFIDPTNSGPQIALNALIAAFVDASGVVLEAFAPGNGPFTIVAPLGAAALQLGVNDDIFTTDFGALDVIDNTGALLIDVTGSTVVAGVPEPGTLSLLLIAMAALAFAAIRARRV